MRPELKYGLISGVAVCAWIALEYLLGLHTTRPQIGEYTGLLSNLIPLTTLFLLLRRKRAAVYDGRLSLASGIGSGLYASFVAALLIYTFLVSYTHFINPGWIDHALDTKVAQLRAAQVSETVIRDRITLFRHSYTPVGLLNSVVVNMTLMGGVYALVLTMVVRQLPHSRAE